ncbi:hypothetical protein OS493_009464 [Desmophyllum pertusum]|uniref:Uncharacterized protein n=1 Tax=Desmophyllum pertusum TaxID=174260 RepID=A0A9X0CS83_9CNID|nr:hypothetical protein OS493_009464 [Desmophyllum pertusum]
MKVICAGLSKTGTTSLAKAFQVLGYNVHDVHEQLTLHRQEWLDSFETDHLPNFKEMFKGVDAITDVPAAVWFEEISDAFPEAKVILTVRDSEEAWLRSWQEHLRMIKELWPFYLRVLLHIAPSRRKTHHFFMTVHHAISGSVNPEASALYRAKYRQHNARVQAVIPAERLLIYNVKQGWKPLCEFLRCDVPSTPFPRANVGHSGTKSQMTEQIEEHKNEAFKLITYIFVFAMCLLATFLMLYVIG